jgi:hypothetical protein
MLYMRQYAEDSTPVQPNVTQFFTSLSDEMESLYLLSLLLTADRGKAEQCFIAAVEEYVAQDGTFIEWGRLQARRIVCKGAIQMIRPEPERTGSLPCASLDGTTASAKNSPFSEILSLGEFERFVFVLSVLEGESDRDCAALLRCSHLDVLMARALALTCLAQPDRAFTSMDQIPQA